jgi:hypothetical protein
MSVQPIRYRSISRRAASPELHVRFGTPGLERTTFASLAYEAVPESIDPIAEIEWPRADPNAAPIQLEKRLSEIRSTNLQSLRDLRRFHNRLRFRI